MVDRTPPDLTQFGRHSGQTLKDKQDLFLAALMESVSDKEACAKAGISRTTIYGWIKREAENPPPEDSGPTFTERLAEVEVLRGKNLESRMFAVLDWATEEEQYEKLLRHPNLLMFALRGLMPTKYGYRIGASVEDTKRIIDQLMGMKDDPAGRVRDGAAFEDELDGILGRVDGR